MNTSKLKSFRVIGVLTLFWGISAIVLYFANTEARRAGGRDLSPLLWPAVFGIVLSICVIRMMQWAIILVSVCYAGFGVWMIVGSIRSVPFPWLLLNLSLGLALFFPIIVLIKTTTARRRDMDQ